MNRNINKALVLVAERYVAEIVAMRRGGVASDDERIVKRRNEFNEAVGILLYGEIEEGVNRR